MSINISAHFEALAGTYKLYRLKDTERVNLLAHLSEVFPLCFVPATKLDSLAILHGKSRGEVLLENFLPTVGNIRAGDFGEIFCYRLLYSLKENEGKVVFGPYKWQWKEGPDSPMHKTDVILFHSESSTNPSPNDEMIAVESKMKSTASPRTTPIKDAIEGAQKDKVSRAAKTLNWLKKKYGQDGKIQEGLALIRFLNPVDYGSYVRQFKAIAIIDSNLVSGEIAKNAQPLASGTDIEVIVVSIPRLQEAYEEVYTKTAQLP